MTTQEPIVEMHGITYAYSGRGPVLDQLEFTLRRGDRIGLIAPNGSGKTTLFHLIMGLLKPDEGTICVFGRPVKEEKDFRQVRRQVGLLFQDADDQLFSPTVLEDVAFGPLNLGRSKAEAVAISRETLDFLGLNGFEGRVTFALSGGEKRMVALATVLAMDPDILLLDEPSAGLDEETKKRLIQVLNQLRKSYVVVSHEFEFITQVTDDIYTIKDGKILLDREAQVHRHIHAHPYGTQPHKHV